MNQQEIFDTVVKHLRKQNCQSKKNNGCLYRGPNNTKCAVGYLIPDEDYRGWMDNIDDTGIETLIYSKDFPNSLSWMKEHVEFLSCLQQLHDENDPKDWEICFANVAEEWGLNIIPKE